MLITEDYRKINAVLHGKAGYGIGGHRWAEKVADIANRIGARTILDYGCGKATLAEKLNSFTVSNYDPAIERYSGRPDPADLVVCLDVLEHIEPECLDDVLADIAALTLKQAFLVIATRPARKVLPDGRNAHLILESAGWWTLKLLEHFDISIPPKIDQEVGEVVFHVSREMAK